MANRLILGKVGICNCLCMGRDLFFVTQLPVLSNMILFTAWRRLLYNWPSYESTRFAFIRRETELIVLESVEMQKASTSAITSEHPL